jgi:hypothetical protein
MLTLAKNSVHPYFSLIQDVSVRVTVFLPMSYTAAYRQP